MSKQTQEAAATLRPDYSLGCRAVSSLELVGIPLPLGLFRFRESVLRPFLGSAALSIFYCKLEAECTGGPWEVNR